MSPNHPMVLRTIETAKSNLKSSSQLLPTFFVGNEKSINVIGTPFSTEKEKDTVTLAIKAAAKELGATFVLFISEVWTIKDQDALNDYIENKHKYKSVKEHPMAKECIMFSLETPYKQFVGMAPILADREMGQVEWIKEAELTGRLSNFFDRIPTH